MQLRTAAKCKKRTDISRFDNINTETTSCQTKENLVKIKIC